MTKRCHTNIQKWGGDGWDGDANDAEPLLTAKVCETQLSMLLFFRFSHCITLHRMDKWRVTHKLFRKKNKQCTKSKPRYRCRFPLQGKEPSPFPWSTRTSCKLASTSSLAPNASSCRQQTGSSAHCKAVDMIHYAIRCWHVQGLWEWEIVGLDLSENWHFLKDIYDINHIC